MLNWVRLRKKKHKFIQMRYLLLSLFILFSSVTFGQTVQVEDAPFKGAQKIMAAYSLQGEELFTYICRQLLEEGYTPDKINREFHFITTEEKNVQNMVYVMRIYIKGDVVEFSAREAFADEKSEQEKRQMVYGANFGLFTHNECFNEMIQFITGTKPEKIRYSR